MDEALFVSAASFWTPSYLGEASPWAVHIPFAFWLVETCRPDVVVEIGRLPGNSYFAFCQATQQLLLGSRCYGFALTAAIAETAPVRLEEAMLGASQINRYHFGAFSRLACASPEEAVSGFEEGTVDLLHIDVRASQEDVRRVFEAWLPRMSRRGVVLVHNTQASHSATNARRFLKEQALRFPTFEFLHGEGLGVVGVGDELPAGIDRFLRACSDRAVGQRVRDQYARLGQSSLDRVVREDLERRGQMADPALRALERENQAMLERLARLQGEYDVLAGALQQIEQSLGFMMIRIAGRLRARVFRPGTIAGRCWSLSSRFVKKSMTAGPHVAARKVAGKLRRKCAAVLRRSEGVEGSDSAIQSERPSAPGGPLPPATFDDLPWRFASGPVSRDGEKRGGYFKILLVSHNASRLGAPLCLLQLAEELARFDDFDCRIVLDRGGELAEAFARIAPTLEVDALEAHGVARCQVPELLAALYRQYAGHGVAICNTAALSSYYVAFAARDVPVLAWVHELPTTIELYYGGRTIVEQIVRAARRIITPSRFVRRALIERYGVAPEQVLAMHYGVKSPLDLARRVRVRALIRADLGVSPDARLVLGCGTVDLRKGVDLFAQVARRVLLSGEKTEGDFSFDIWFIWVGHLSDPALKNWLSHDAETAGIKDRIRFVGPCDDPSPYFQAADVFVLTSREDPFPCVNLEAIASGLPVVAFEGAGGAPEVLDRAGVVVPYLDVDAMGEAVVRLLSDDRAREAAGRAALELARQHLTWDRFVDELTQLFREQYSYHPAQALDVSVIVPNYNHAPFLEERLRSIFAQTRRPREIIVLDDASHDDSVAIIRRLAADSPVPLTILVNQRNSGSPFQQWLKGIELARGSLVWIAESDDSCRENFLETLVPEFYDPEVVLAYSQSEAIGPDGQRYSGDYLFFTDDVSKSRWRSRYVAAGDDEVERALSQKNTILNVSAVVFRRAANRDFAAELAQFRFAGDWFFYAMLIRGGKIAFVPAALNRHRRHGCTVTHMSEREDLYVEETLQVRARLFETYRVSSSAIAQSLGRAVLDYHRLNRKLGLDRASLTAQPALAPTLERIRRVLEGHRCWQGSLTILMILPDLEVGGGQIAAIRLANALAKRHRVLLCNAQPELLDARLTELIDESVLLLEGTLGPAPWSSDGPHFPHGVEPDPARERRIEVLRELIRFHRVDVIHSHVWAADRLAFELNQKLDLPWFIHMHGCYEALCENPHWDPAFDAIVGSMMAMARGVFYLAEKNLRVFFERAIPRPRRLIHVPNGLDPGRVRAGGDGSVVREESDFCFVLSSRAIPEKGWEGAIIAIRRINALPSSERGGRRARLILIGDGYHAEEVRRRFADEPAVTFLGQLNHPVDTIVQCDAGLLPSWFVSESAPLAIIEYLACGLPVIATDRGSIPQMIRHEDRVAGIIVSLGAEQTLDVPRLARAMLCYLTNEPLYNEHRANARAVFEVQFHIDRLVRTCEEAYHDAVHKSLQWTQSHERDRGAPHAGQDPGVQAGRTRAPGCHTRASARDAGQGTGSVHGDH
jgi:glycosyltransferase involved in cell wall biosynthesis